MITGGCPGPVTLLPPNIDMSTPAASTSAASSSVTVGEMEGVMFFLEVPSELDSLRMNRVARLLLFLLAVGLVAADPALEPEPLDADPVRFLPTLLSASSSPLVSAVWEEGEKALARPLGVGAGLFCSMDDLRLLMLRRRGKTPL